MKRLLWIILTTLPLFAWSDEGVDITDPQQIGELLKLQVYIDTIGTRVKHCMDDGNTHEACLCENEKLILEFNAFVEDLFASYPDLSELELVRFRAPDGLWIAQSPTAIRKQARTIPSCGD